MIEVQRRLFYNRDLERLLSFVMQMKLRWEEATELTKRYMHFEKLVHRQKTTLWLQVKAWGGTLLDAKEPPYYSFDDAAKQNAFELKLDPWLDDVEQIPEFDIMNISLTYQQNSSIGQEIKSKLGTIINFRLVSSL